MLSKYEMDDIAEPYFLIEPIYAVYTIRASKLIMPYHFQRRITGLVIQRDIEGYIETVGCQEVKKGVGSIDHFQVFLEAIPFR